MIDFKKAINSDSLDTIGSKQVKSEKTPKELFLKKRKNKVITKASMYKMFGLQDSPLLKDYRQAYRCNEAIIKDPNTGKITVYYCKKRCCTVCARIKSAQSLAKYAEAILKLEDLYLVTLTNVNVLKGELNDETSRMVEVISKIRVNMRVQGIKLNGYKSFECTYSRYKGFNPHFHLVVQGKEVAEMLLFIGYTKGKFNADLMMLLLEPVMYMLLAIAEAVGIEPKINRDDFINADEEVLDEEDEQDIVNLSSSMENQIRNPQKLDELQVNLESKIPQDIKERVAEVDFEEIKESLLARPAKQEPQNNSLLGR